MKISRTIIVSNNSACIDAPIYLYKGDGNILISLDIINITISIKLNQMSTTSYINDNISYATACLCKRDSSSTFHIVGTKVNDKIEFELKKDMIDEIVEVGEYIMQVHLFDKKNNRLTIPVVEKINIMLPLCSDGYTPPITYSSKIGEATVDYSKVVAECATTSSDFYYTYNWTTGEYITANKLNNMITGIDEALYDIKNIQNNYATKSELNNKANKNEIPTKVSQLLNDKGYLTEHQDLSNFATKSYVDSEIAKAQLEGGEVDLSGYATKDELNNKSDEGHSHPEYVNPDLSGYLVSNTILRIEVVDELPEIEEEGVLYICNIYINDEEIPTTAKNLYYQTQQKTYVSEGSGYEYTFDTDNTFVINTTVESLSKDIDKKSNTFDIQLESDKTYKFKASYISGSATFQIKLYFKNDVDDTKYAELKLENNKDAEVKFTVTSSASITGILSFYGYSGANYSDLKYGIEIFEV